MGVGLGAGTSVDDADGGTVGDGDADADGDAVGAGVEVGDAVGLGVAVGLGEGVEVGPDVTVGAAVRVGAGVLPAAPWPSVSINPTMSSANTSIAQYSATARSGQASPPRSSGSMWARG
jgi:UDP-3-O-[3-hydroxymyristoyl] glucosamine N-acyltransferase